jgi:pimeloyl-ACP methyl ester carboxylesterase
MDAVGFVKAALFGRSEGGPAAILFAATRPERTAALILHGTFPFVGMAWEDLDRDEGELQARLKSVADQAQIGEEHLPTMQQFLRWRELGLAAWPSFYIRAIPKVSPARKAQASARFIGLPRLCADEIPALCLDYPVTNRGGGPSTDVAAVADRSVGSDVDAWRGDGDGVARTLGVVVAAVGVTADRGAEAAGCVEGADAVDFECGAGGI